MSHSVTETGLGACTRFLLFFYSDAEVWTEVAFPSTSGCMHTGLSKSGLSHVMGLASGGLPSAPTAFSFCVHRTTSTSFRPHPVKTHSYSRLCSWAPSALGRIRTCPRPRNPNFGALRAIAWAAKMKAQHEFNGPGDGQEEAAKAAILDKVMKGRQPTDLMLRCQSSPI
jgi:hypothetical protein